MGDVCEGVSIWLKQEHSQTLYSALVWEQKNDLGKQPSAATEHPILSSSSALPTISRSHHWPLTPTPTISRAIAASEASHPGSLNSSNSFATRSRHPRNRCAYTCRPVSTSLCLRLIGIEASIALRTGGVLN